MGSFTLGALLPLVAILLPPVGARVLVTALAVVAALALTGWGSARLGQAPPRPAIVRNVFGGILAMAVTYGIGALVGTQL
jgi:VIT1/CCC1 family predicted Fe2+/Mn2+ transporter